MKGLKAKVALVTGAAHGIGAASARRLAEEGASLAVTDVQDEEGQALTGELENIGARAIYIHHDVSLETDWRSAVQRTLETFGGLHVLANNQTGVWLGMKHAGPEMRKAGTGSIVNISSIFGAVGGFGGSVAYHAAKGAVRLMTKNAALRYAKEGVRVNSVHPGFIDTPMIAPIKDAGDPRCDRPTRRSSR
jgi:NAD(P)-dependent dehydrogenase (short-subunit alcohol dehydrogenase family)